MRELKVVYNGIKPIACGTSASGQIGTFRAVFTFSPDWDAYPERTAVFVANGEPIGILLDKDNSCEIHKEITENAGRILVGAFGVGMDANGRAVRYPGEYTCTNISEGATADVKDPTPEEVTLYEKMLARLAQAETEAQEATENANNAADNAKSAADRANEAAERAEAVNPDGGVQSVNGKTGAVQLSAGDVGALPASTKIPKKTSDLENDRDFVTRIVSDLAYYYNKSETYTQEEIRALISAIPKFAISVVTALPTQDISETTVYLLKSGEGSGDLYTEYIYAGGAWEILGSQRVDLTGYATEAWVTGKLADYITPETLTYAMITAALGYTPAKESDIPNVPVQSVNGKTGTVQLSASDVNALPKDTPIPEKTSEITNDSGYITIAVATLLNYYLKSETFSRDETYSRTDIDGFISGLDKRLNAIADSDDETLDQMSEIVEYIKSNKSLIDAITTSKVNVSDIVDSLTSTAANKPLSAKQGAALKALIDGIIIPTSLPASDVYAWAKQPQKPSYTAKEVGAAAAEQFEELSVEFDESKIPYIVGDSTTAGEWTGTISGITEYREGMTILYKINVAGVSGGTTLNINGLGAIPVHRNASTAVTTIYPVGSVVMLTYSGGAWLTADYDANTKNTAGTSNKADTKMLLVGATSQTSSGTTTYTNNKVYIGTDNCLYSNGKKVADDDQVGALSNEISEYSTLTLGIHTDGLVYIFRNGEPVGTGVEFGSVGDVIGYVDASNRIVIKGNLADGEYTVAYEMDDGTEVDIGNLTLGEAPLVYTDLVPTAKGTDGNVLDGVGYRREYRWSSSAGTLSGQSGYTAVGAMGVTGGKELTVYVYGLNLDGTNYSILLAQSALGTAPKNFSYKLTGGFTGSTFVTSVEKLADYYYKITTMATDSSVNWFALSGKTVSGVVPIVTLNEPIFKV